MAVPVKLLFAPQMQRVADYFAGCPLYSSQPILTLDRLGSALKAGDKAVVFGRHGNHHDDDLSYIRSLRESGGIPGYEDTTLVLFDWHEDLDNDVEGTELTPGSWAYLGLENDQYSNIYIIGTNPRGLNEINPWRCEEDEFRLSQSGTWRQIDRIHLFPALPCHAFLRLMPDWSTRISDNESIVDYFAPDGGGFAVVKLKGMDEVSYTDRRRSVVVSIDLDVLKRSVVKTVCPQGIMDLGCLRSHLHRLADTGDIDAVLICGLTEDEEEQDEVSLGTVASLLAEVTSLLRE
jgi:hypothetical protein